MRKTVFWVFLVWGVILWVPPSGDCAGKKEKISMAPAFPRKGIWLNQKPAKDELFNQRVTLVYFWDYTSVNCLRELARLNRWFAHYHPYGLDFIFVHAPEFEFAQKKENVERAVERLQIPYPIFLDNRFKLWDKYGTKAWPMKYLVDPKGMIVYAQGGEGEYQAIEEKMRELLNKLQPGAVLPEPLYQHSSKQEMDFFNIKKCGGMSPETYVGYQRAAWWGAEIATKRGVLPDQTVDYRDRGKRVERGFFAEGLWTNRKDYFEHARDTAFVSDYLGMLYVAREAYAVLSQAEEGARATRIYVTRDGQPIPEILQGKDLQEDLSGGTFLLLEEPRLYYLIANEDNDPHELKLWTQKKGVAVHSFSFSNHCLSQFEHL